MSRGLSSFTRLLIKQQTLIRLAAGAAFLFAGAVYTLVSVYILSFGVHAPGSVPYLAFMSLVSMVSAHPATAISRVAAEPFIHLAFALASSAVGAGMLRPFLSARVSGSGENEPAATSGETSNG